MRQSSGGDVFPAVRLPSVPQCLPGGVRQREAGGADAFVPGREHGDWRESIRHRGGCHLGAGHVRKPVRAQLQRVLTVHQRGPGSVLTNGKDLCFI